MGVDLFGKQVQDTYDALIKVGDNNTLTSTAKRLSDGRGTDAPIWLSTTKMGIGVTPDLNYTVTINGSLKATDIDTTNLQFLGGTGNQGTLSWNTDEETVDIIQNGATLQVGQETQVHVKNQTGAGIPDGTPVYVTGTLGSSGRLTVAPMIADGTIEAKYFLGVTTEDIPDGEDGKVTTFGKIRGLDTSAYTEGQTLFVSATTAGAFQTTAPISPNLDLEVAIVINVSATVGTIFVRANNGLYLPMLHDVYVNGVADGDILVYNSTEERWENNAGGGTNITLQDVTDDGNTTTNFIALNYGAEQTGFNGNSSLRISRNANPSFIQFISPNTEQQGILFGDLDDSVEGSLRYNHNGDYMWFETNNAERVRITSAGQVGIGTSNPVGDLHVKSNAPTIAATSENNVSGLRFNVDGTAIDVYRFQYNGTTFMTVRDTGNLGIGVSPNSAAKLHVQDDDGAEIRLEDNTSTTFEILRLVGDASTESRGLIAYNSANTFSANNLWLFNAGGDVIIGASTGGGTATERMRVDATDGSVLINTTSNAMTSVFGSADTAQFKVNGTLGHIAISDSGNFLEFSRNSANYIYASGANSTLAFGAGGSESMRIMGDGYIGINTSLPNDYLHTFSDDNGKGLTISRNSVTEGDYAQLSFLVSTSTYSSASAYIRAIRGANFGEDDLSFSTGSIQRVRIDGITGNVGIGVLPNASSKLHVQDNDGAEIRLEDNTSTTFEVLRFVGDAGTYDKGLIGYNSANAFDADSLHLFNPAGDIVFRADTGGGTGAERVRITGATGRVGVGTTNPQAEFVVSNSGAYGLEIDPYNQSNSVRLLAFDRAGSTRVPFRLDGEPIIFQKDTLNELARFADNGSLGIGTNAPNAGTKLHVKGDGGGNAEIRIEDNTSTTFEVLRFIGDSGTYEKGLIGYNSANAYDADALHLFNAAGDVVFRTATGGGSGTERVRITSSGEMGVGTTNPENILHVQDNINDDVLIHVSNPNTGSSSAAGLYLQGQGNNFFLRNYGDGTATPNITEFKSVAGSSSFVFSPAGSEAMRIDQIGRVGIGTDTPSAFLHIKSDLSSNQDQFLIESTVETGSTAPDIAFYKNRTTPANNDNLGAIWFYGNDSIGDQSIFSAIYSRSVDVTNGSEKGLINFLNIDGGSLITAMTINEDRVGIGTETPSLSAALHILDNTGKSEVRIESQTTTSFEALRFIGDASTYEKYLIGYNSANAFSPNNLHLVNAGGDIIFATETAGGASERVRVTDNGFVGINKTSPEGQLHIYRDATIGSVSSPDVSQAGLVIEETTGTSKMFFDGNTIRTSSTIVIGPTNANPVIFVNDNTERVRITGSGDVGIGTASPLYKLHVNGDARANTRLVVAGLDTGNPAIATDNVHLSGYGLGGNRGTFYFTNQAVDGIIAFGIGGVHNANRVMTMLPDRVGIGTTAPDAATKLHIADNDGVEIRLEDNTSTTFQILRFVGDASAGEKGLISYNSANAFDANSLRLFNNEGDVVLASSTGGGTAIERLRVDGSTGNVGVGTTNPSNPVHIYKNATLGSPTSPTVSNAGLRIQDSFNSMYFDGNAIVSVGAGNFEIGAATTSIILITNGAERALIDDSGNFGIGSTTPSHRLHVVENTFNIAVFAIDSSNSKYLSVGVNDGAGYAQITAGSGTTENVDLSINTATGGSETEKVRITHDGLVGFGTSTPASEFHISADAPIMTVTSTNNASGLRLNIDGTSTRLLRLQYGGSTIHQFDPNGDYLAVGSDARHTIENGSGVQALQTGHSTGGGGGFLSLRNDSDTQNILLRSYGDSFTLNNLGVGTNSVAARLHLSGGNMYVDGVSGFGYSHSIIFRTTSSSEDIGMRSVGEGFEIYEPEQSDKIWFRILDDPEGNSAAALLNSPSGLTPILTDYNKGDYVDSTYVRSFVDSTYVRSFVDSTYVRSFVDKTYIDGLNVDAATLDGRTATEFFINGDTIINMGNNDGFAYDDTTNTMKVIYDGSYYDIWTTANDGAGSGLDADLLDGVNSTQFIRSDTNDTFTGSVLTINNNLGIGTSSPSHNLHVYSGATNVTSTFESGDATAYINIKDNATTNYGALLGVTGSEFFISTSDSLNEHFRIDNSGNVGIGTSAPNADLDVNGPIRSRGGSYSSGIDSRSDVGLVIQENDFIYGEYQSNYLRVLIGITGGNIEIGQTGTGLIGDIILKTGTSGNVKFFTDGGETMRLDSSSNLHVDADIIGYSTTTSSDIKLKQNISDIENPLEIINELQGVHFEWKRNGKKSLGFIAQNVEKVLPELVTEVDDLRNEGETYKTVNYPVMVAVLNEAIKEQQKQIEDLKAEINHIKGLF